MWEIFYLLAFTTILIFWRGPNPVWGGCVAGALIGCAISAVQFLSGKGFHWEPISKSAAILTIVLGAWELVEHFRGNNADWH